MVLKDSKTFANLMAAFAGEAQARNKYTYYGTNARKEGYNHISDIFEETAKNELAHAKLWFDLINGGETKTTVDSLKDAAGGEHYEWSEMYKEFAEVAKSEGFTDIARLFEGVAAIEKLHEERFRKYIDELNGNTVFKKDTKVTWKCANCGHEHTGESAPELCPVCKHPKAFFCVDTSKK